MGILKILYLYKSNNKKIMYCYWQFTYVAHIHMYNFNLNHSNIIYLTSVCPLLTLNPAYPAT